MLTINEILGPDGPLAKAIEGFAPRDQQLEMSQAVETALESGNVLIAEAGTGTGKTLAYLVPVVLSGKKAIVSTGTKNLQDQLFHRDLPVLCEALKISIDAALLKGRANYLCRFRLRHQVTEGRLFNREQVDQLMQVESWAGRTRLGDISEFGDIPEDSPVWSMVTSTADNCLGQECPDLGECHLVKARKRAQAADIVVVNHHLLLADMALKEEGFGELLPGASVFVLDEAHQLPEVAANFFSVSLTSRQITDLCRDTLVEQTRDAADVGEISNLIGSLELALKKTRLALGAGTRRAAWDEVVDDGEVQLAIDLLQKSLSGLRSQLEIVAPRSKGLESCWKRSMEMTERLEMVTGPSPDNYVRWFETFTKSFAVYLTPLQVAEQFQAQLSRFDAAWVFTSATLAVGDSFEHFQSQLGLSDAKTHKWDSPFDYPMQALLYVPTELPEPNSQLYTDAVVEAAIDVLNASGGRAFLLFTSHRALREAEEKLAKRIEYPILVQGSAPKAELLERFTRHGNAVLLGTSSFWEGVDVRGSALSLVVIDKLPFASPGDPIIQARIDTMRESGKNPFMEYQLPNAVIALKQGVGRLIRDVNDYGVLMLCDPRLLTKSYGNIFLGSLPAMSKTRKIEVVKRFYSIDRDNYEAVS